MFRDKEPISVIPLSMPVDLSVKRHEVSPKLLSRTFEYELMSCARRRHEDSHTDFPAMSEGEYLERGACFGDIITIDLNLTPEHDFVPEPLFDTSGTVSFVLGWGNYLPGLHSLLLGMKVGELTQDDVSIDAGWGQRNPNLVAKISKKAGKLPKKLSNIDLDSIKVGMKIKLSSSLTATVTEANDDCFVVDANSPLAGASYSANVTVLGLEYAPDLSLLKLRPINADLPSAPIENAVDDISLKERSNGQYAIAVFGLGCFWGGELAFMRIPGVVGTKVGYTQGRHDNPTYEEVCAGKTSHTEAILVVFDSTRVSYETLLHTAMNRLQKLTSAYRINAIGYEDEEEELDDGGASAQYRHGIFYTTDEQRQTAQKILKVYKESRRRLRVVLKNASTFYEAEEYHQQYLLKGGQSAKKGAKDKIRCFG